MPMLVERAQQVPAMVAARAIVLVSVPWSPWPRKSRDVLTALEQSLELWSPDASVEFFDLWPEREDGLNRWYEEICKSHFPQLELHGHGYGPLWWMAHGVVLDCLTKPYEHPLTLLRQRSAARHW